MHSLFPYVPANSPPSRKSAPGRKPAMRIITYTYLFHGRLYPADIVEQLKTKQKVPKQYLTEVFPGEYVAIHAPGRCIDFVKTDLSVLNSNMKVMAVDQAKKALVKFHRTKWDQWQRATKLELQQLDSLLSAANALVESRVNGENKAITAGKANYFVAQVQEKTWFKTELEGQTFMKSVREQILKQRQGVFGSKCTKREMPVVLPCDFR